MQPCGSKPSLEKRLKQSVDFIIADRLKYIDTVLTKKKIRLVEMVIFIVILLVGYVYAWKKGALEWE